MIDTQLLAQLAERVGAQWQPGATRFTNVSRDEFSQYLGLDDRMDPDTEEGDGFQIAAELAPAPATFDLRDVGGVDYVTDIRDQSKCGSCVAFACLACTEGTARFAARDPALAIDLSEAHLFYCHGRSQGRNCSNGWTPGGAFPFLVRPGVVGEDCYMYDLSHKTCDALCSDWKTRLWTIDGFQRVRSSSSIEAWISSQGPATACMDVYEDFSRYRSGVYQHVHGERVGGHCVALVGYDRNQGYWIAKNSWGDDWGEAGFFRIRYGSCRIDSWAVHGVSRVSPPSKV